MEHPVQVIIIAPSWGSVIASKVTHCSEYVLTVFLSSLHNIII